MKALLASILMFASPIVFAAMGTPSVEWMIHVLIYLIVIGLIFWLCIWAIGAIGLPEPFNKVAHVVIILVAFIIMLYFLLGILGPIPTR